jgi:hypothetical protein
MRISDYFNLNRTQAELDFVDVDVLGDVRVFVDPRALRLLDSEWGAECRSLLRNCFSTVIDFIGSGHEHEARQILSSLREPNETHLGLSIGRAQGRALGPESAIDVADSLATSTAARTGLLEDLEDTILMVEGIGPDIVSDMTTNIIRGPLIRYTKDICAYYDIPVQEVSSGRIWNPETRDWFTQMVQQPVAEGQRLLLVPKAIVRIVSDYDPGQYYRLYLLEHLKHVELSANTELVRLLKSGETRVYIKDLMQKYGVGKHAIVDITRRYPEILERYRSDKRQILQRTLDHSELSFLTGSPLPDLNGLLDDVLVTPLGTEHASEYQQKIEKLLSALFSEDLSWPELEQRIHDGRKRIDITYTNVSAEGFFKWVGDHAPAPYVFVECKNYSRDIANPELDQIAGRFSPRRGKFGIIICRKLDNKDLFMQRCRDTAGDDRGFIVPLDDDDLRIIVQQAQAEQRIPGDYPYLRERYNRLVL